MTTTIAGTHLRNRTGDGLALSGTRTKSPLQPVAMSARIAAGSSLRGLSLVTITPVGKETRHPPHHLPLGAIPVTATAEYGDQVTGNVRPE